MTEKKMQKNNQVKIDILVITVLVSPVLVKQNQNPQTMGVLLIGEELENRCLRFYSAYIDHLKIAVHLTLLYCRGIASHRLLCIVSQPGQLRQTFSTWNGFFLMAMYQCL